MTLRRIAAAAAGTLGIAAVINRALAWRAASLEPALPGDVGRFRWRGFDISYAEAGDPEDPDLLLVHGIHAAASNKEFDRVVADLAESYHVIAPDLPGFGLSDRPPLVYSDSLYTTFLADFAQEVTTDAVCIASSLSASYVARVQADSGPFSRLVLICPTEQTARRRPYIRGLLRSPVVGTFIYNAIASKRALRWFSESQAVADPAAMTAEDIDHFWQTAHQPGAKYAPASFISGYLDPDIDLAETLADVDVPVTLIWGRDATVSPLTKGRELAETADVRLVVIDASRLLPHHEHPVQFLEAVDTDLPELTNG